MNSMKKYFIFKQRSKLKSLEKNEKKFENTAKWRLGMRQRDTRAQRVGRGVAIAEGVGQPFAVKLLLLLGKLGKMHWAQLSV